MGALERYDEWDAGVDDRLDGAGTPLEELYDADVLQAIDTRSGEPNALAAPWRGAAAAVAAGAAITGLARGMREVLAEDDAEPEWAAEIEVARMDRRLEPVTVILVPGDPAASVALVRRWLF